jgi:processive 1,2-diacylglycerol beta-glucosyltransferase
LRILVLSCSVGAGHIRAAEAIELALARCGSAQPATPLTVENIDVLTLMPKSFQKVYRDAYFAMVAKSPAVLGWLYDKTNKPFHREPLREKLERVNASAVLERIRDFDPDVAICTHFLPAALLARECRKGRSRAKIITVVTDFEVHGLWLKAPSDHYFVATEEARVHLAALGVDPATVTVSGIPTHPLFSEKKDRLAMRRKHGLREDLPVVLLSAGGFGAGNAARMVQSLIAAETPAQIVAVCGKSAVLKRSLEELAGSRPSKTLPLIQVVGFTTGMDEYMSAADLMIGKPGGLTTSESLVKGLGWVVVNPIPGQEEKNAVYLLEHGVGIWSDNLHTLAYKVSSLLDEPGRLASMRKNALRLARPAAAHEIAEFAVNQRT